MTREIILAILSSGALLGQVRATLLPQPSVIPGMTQYGVEVCSVSSVTVSSGLIYAAASTQISPVLPSKVEEMLGEYTRTRWQRKLLLVLEYASWGAGAAAGSGLIKIKEPALAAAFPAVGALLRTTTTAWKTQVPAYRMPANILPPIFQVAAGGCGEYSLFARSKAEEKPFTVEVAAKP